MPPEQPSEIEMMQWSPEEASFGISFTLLDFDVERSKIETAIHSLLVRNDIHADSEISIEPPDQLIVTITPKEGISLGDTTEKSVLAILLENELKDQRIIEVTKESVIEVPNVLSEEENAGEPMFMEVATELASAEGERFFYDDVPIDEHSEQSGEEGEPEYTIALALLPTEANLRKARTGITSFLSDYQDRTYEFSESLEGSARAGQEVVVGIFPEQVESEGEQFEFAADLWNFLHDAGVQFTAKPEHSVQADYSLYAKVDAHPETELAQLEALSRNVRVHAETLESLIGLDFDAPVSEALFEAQHDYFSQYADQSIASGMEQIEDDLVRLRSAALNGDELSDLESTLNHSFASRLSVLSKLSEHAVAAEDTALKARLWILMRLTGMSLLASIKDVQQVSELNSCAQSWRVQLSEMIQTMRENGHAVGWMPNSASEQQWNELVVRGIALDALEAEVQKIVIEAASDMPEDALQEQVNQCIDRHIRLQSEYRSEQPFDVQIDSILGQVVSEYTPQSQQLGMLKRALDLENVMHDDAVVINEVLSYFERDEIDLHALQPLIKSTMAQLASKELELIQRKHALLMSKPYQKIGDLRRDIERLTAIRENVRVPFYLNICSAAYRDQWRNKRRRALGVQLSSRQKEFDALQKGHHQLSSEISALEHTALLKTFGSLCKRIQSGALDVRLSEGGNEVSSNAMANCLQSEHDNFSVLATVQRTVTSRMLKAERYVHVSEIEGLTLAQQHHLLEQKRLGREELNRMLAPETLLSQYLTALGVLDANQEKRKQQLRLFTRGITRTQDLIHKLNVLEQSLKRLSEQDVDVLHIADELYQNRARPGFLARAGHRLQGYGVAVGASGIAGLSAALATHHHPGVFVAGAALAGAVLKGMIDAKGKSVEVEPSDDLMGLEQSVQRSKTQDYETTDVWVEVNSDGSVSKMVGADTVPVGLWNMNNAESSDSVGAHDELKHATSRFSDDVQIAEVFSPDGNAFSSGTGSNRRRPSTDSDMSDFLEDDAPAPGH